MSRRVLLVSTVHRSGDTRIREKTARALSASSQVMLAARPPAPSDLEGLRWIPLEGSRVRRNLRAWRLLLGGGYDVAGVHDPELLPPAIVAGILKRKIVVDVHEDVPEQIRMRRWLPAPLKWIAVPSVRSLLRVAERTCRITLAEEAYSYLFAKSHPVIPNYPDPGLLPPVSASRRPTVVYVGDLTEERGILELIRAAGEAGSVLELVGSSSPEFEQHLQLEARRSGAEIVLHGWLPYREAMRVVAGASVGVSPLRDLPNYRRSLPTKVLEYLALGLPVVATDLPGTRSVVEGLDAVWLVQPGDHRGWMTALRAATEALDTAIAQAPLIRERFRFPDDLVRSIYLD